jgi:hypothetical protein
MSPRSDNKEEPEAPTAQGQIFSASNTYRESRGANISPVFLKFYFFVIIYIIKSILLLELKILA